MKKQSIEHLLSYVKISLLAVLLALNYQLFIVENGFAPAGINGIATMVQYKTGFSIAYMSLLINVPLCVFAFFSIQRAFARRSLCFCLVYSGVYLCLQRLDLTALQYNALDQDTVLPVMLGGIISGLVYGLCFRQNSSTGGTDIVSKYISKRHPKLNFFWVIFALNAVVAAISIFVYAEALPDGSLTFHYKPVCLCVLYCYISSFMGNYMMRGIRSAYRLTVITTHADEIADEILHKLKHGVTKVTGIGVYSNSPRDVLICIVNKHQLVDFENILKKYDNTFSFSEMVSETYGNFARIK